MVGAQEGRAQTAQQSLWSNPDTWPNRKVPVAGDKVIIGRDKDVILDVSPPALGGLSIDGKLTFSNDADLELTTEWIMLHGELAIGSEASPHTRNATIILTNNVTGEDVMAGMGDRGIMISGGTLNLHGDRTNTWTKLASTAKAGSDSIEVLDAAGWRVGDEIVLASTDFDPRQAEQRTIAAIRGNKITLDQKLDYMHFGKITFDVDERGEVGLLTRNIKIQASADAEQSFLGGHIMAMPSSKMYVEGVELHRMGQNLTLARYPIHWHLVGEGKGQYIRNAAIHDTYNRCVTVHGTNNLQVENNVTYNNVGHCFFLEDGIETGNQFVRNLAIQTKCHTSKPCDPTNLAPFGATSDGLNFKTTGQDSKDVLIPSDNTVSTFWITNPDNVYRDNVAAGSDATGFWLAFPEHPIGQFEGTEISKATWPRRTKLREFKGNVAHSNFDSFMGDRAPRADGRFAVGGYISLANPADASSAQVESVIEDFTAYKNRNSAIWARGELRLYKNLKMADNGIGFTQASGNFGQSAYTSRVVDSRFVGESENVGNPTTAAEKAYGRSLPFPEVADFPIRAYEFYDYHHRTGQQHVRELRGQRHPQDGSDLLPAVHQLRNELQQHRVTLEIHQRQAGVFPADRQQVEQRRLRQYGLQDLGVQRQGRHHHRCPQFLHRNERRNRHRRSLRGQAHLERRGVHGRCRAHECWRRWWCCWVRRIRRRRRSSWCRWSSWWRRRSWCRRSSWWRRRSWCRRCRCRSRTSRGSRRWRRRSRCSCPQRCGCWSWRRRPQARCDTCCLCHCPRWWSNQRYPCAFRAASRSQPQWQGVHRGRGNQRTSGHRVQGDHRKANLEHQREGAGCRFVGDVRAAGIHHRSVGYGAEQPGCTSQGQRHLVLQGQRFALGQGRLHR